MMGKYKLIEVNGQENSVECDNPTCDYVVPNPTDDPRHDLDKYLNCPCPKCGDNLLTQKDLDDYIKMLDAIDWINKWFGWIGFFIPRSRYDNVSVKVHDGTLIRKEE